ncbi:hypothetical protein NHQ30_004052 [Ciborinia camelliae]|nr:hypothetical protein NHQ30_004052 [Ciborinia camelliae]
MSHTPGEVQRQAQERSTQLFKDFSRLREILDREEETIRKRWGKKTKIQRTSIVLKCWPELPLKHRPDFDIFFKKRYEGLHHSTAYREFFMHPYMNVEDLIKGKAILLLLNSRGRFPPRIFTFTDLKATNLGQIINAITPRFLEDYIFLLEGENAEQYGRLVALINDPDLAKKTQAGVGYIPSLGLLVLEIQEKVLRFLVKLAEVMLQDVDLGPKFIQLPILPEPPLIEDSTEWTSLASIAAEAPYRLPSSVNFKRLQAIVAAKRSSAEDHIHDLREDPGYFAETINERREHRPELVPDAAGKQHEMVDTPLFWETVVGLAVQDAYSALCVWDIICKALDKLTSIQEKLSASMSPGQPLPEEYSKGLLDLRETVRFASWDAIKNLQSGIPPSPAYRSSCVRVPQPNERVTNEMVVSFKQEARSWDDDMLWLFESIWNQQEQSIIGLPNIVDEIEHMLEHDPNLKGKLSPYMSREFSDLALIAAIQREIDISLPWTAIHDYDPQARKEKLMKEIPLRFKVQNDVYGTLAMGFQSMGRLGNPTVADRFYYPSDQRRTKKNTDAMRAAERNLDQFWKRVDYEYQRHGKTLKKSVEHILQNAREPERTPEWTPPIRVPNRPKKMDNSQQVALPQFSSAEPSESFKAPQPKVKNKTRGKADPPVLDQPPELPLPPDTLATHEKIFKLKARAHRVFKFIFFQPNQTDLPGEITWTDFLYAMNTVGFEIEKLMGSKWQFTPTSGDITRGMQIHQPHSPGSTSKISYVMARRLGGRFRRVYGWHGGMFVLE